MGILQYNSSNSLIILRELRYTSSKSLSRSEIHLAHEERPTNRRLGTALGRSLETRSLRSRRAASNDAASVRVQIRMSNHPKGGNFLGTTWCSEILVGIGLMCDFFWFVLKKSKKVVYEKDPYIYSIHFYVRLKWSCVQKKWEAKRVYFINLSQLWRIVILFSSFFQEVRHFCWRLNHHPIWLDRFPWNKGISLPKSYLSGWGCVRSLT